MKIHHIGYLVDEIETAAKEFERVGFSRTGGIAEDLSRGIYILFLDNNGHVVELIQPMGEAFPIHRLRKKHRNSPYHICYETNNLQKEIEKMVNFDSEGAIFYYNRPHQLRRYRGVRMWHFW